MELIPSIDLLGGWVVKLTGGVRSTSWRISPDPLAVARGWLVRGASWIHLVDLDAAFGTGRNTRAMASVIRGLRPGRFEVSGGVRSSAAVRAWLRRGARRVIVGTRAVKDPGWLERASREFRNKLFVAVDSRGDRIVVRGWTKEAGLRLSEYIAGVDGLGFGGYLYTDVRVEGRGRGFDRAAVRRMVGLTDKPVIYSGGVTSLADVRALKRMGAAGAIVGAAFYRGTLSFEKALKVVVS